MKAIRVHQVGGPEVLRLEDLPTPKVNPGQVLVRVEAVGVNHMDVSQRAGSWPLPLPYTPGWEMAGTVEATGEGVNHLPVGLRVACPNLPAPGGYAEYVVVPAALLIPLPDAISTRQAAAVLLQGFTAHALIFTVYPVRQGDTVLIHSAAGGVGQLAVQLAKRRGARVLGTVSTASKVQAARSAGADEVIVTGESDFTEEVRRLTEGVGVHAVYDAVGRETFTKGLDALRPRGVMVSYGNASGPVDPVPLTDLLHRGSLFVTRLSAADYFSTPQEIGAAVRDLFTWVERGELRVQIEHELPLSQAAEAHRLMASRQTTGKLLLIPG